MGKLNCIHNAADFEVTIKNQKFTGYGKNSLKTLKSKLEKPKAPSMNCLRVSVIILENQAEYRKIKVQLRSINYNAMLQPNNSLALNQYSIKYFLQF